MAKYKTTKEIVEMLPEFIEASEMLSILEGNAPALADPVAEVLIKKLKDNIKVKSHDDSVYRKRELKLEKELAAQVAAEKKEDEPIIPKIIRKRVVIGNLKKSVIAGKISPPPAESAAPSPEPPTVIYCAPAEPPNVILSAPVEKAVESVDDWEATGCGKEETAHA